MTLTRLLMIFPLALDLLELEPLILEQMKLLQELSFLEFQK